MKKIIGLFCLVMALAGNAVNAEIPATINYQGYCEDANNNPLNGEMAVIFRLYKSGETQTIWTENQNVTFEKGFFNVELGSNTSLSGLDFSDPYLLGIQIGTEELTPRSQLNSAPYALRAKNTPPLAQSGAIDLSPQQGSRVYFYLDAAPRKILLFIKGEKCNPLFYTEVGAHSHAVSVTHSHTVTLGSHAHGIDHDYIGGWVATSGSSPHSTDNPNMIIATDLGPKTTSSNAPGSTNNTGLSQSGISLHTGSAYEYLNNTSFNIDGVDKTTGLENIIGWSEIGNGTSSHAFVTTGSGFVDITDLTAWEPGQHYLGFDCSVGGRINYTLYIYY